MTILDFEQYQKIKLEKIKALSCGNDLFKKILYVSFFDSIAACVYPSKGNRERFVLLIEKFSCWEHGGRVSLSHLCKFIEMYDDEVSEGSKKYLIRMLGEWKSCFGEYIDIKKDLDENDPKLIGFFVKEKRSRKTKVKLSYFTHRSLLYNLRNSLVHNFQSANEMGRNIPAFPFYQWVDINDGEKEYSHLELIYPVKFLEKLAFDVLSNTARYFSSQNENPFPKFYAGDYLLRELNF